jgi:hypothetical protein
MNRDLSAALTATEDRAERRQKREVYGQTPEFELAAKDGLLNLLANHIANGLGRRAPYSEHNLRFMPPILLANAGVSALLDAVARPSDKPEFRAQRQVVAIGRLIRTAEWEEA